MAAEEEILSLMRMRGPLLPADVAKQIKTNILLGSAYLSELASRKKVKISYLKVGGSPLYYLQGQEEKLEEFASNLNEKELRAFEILKEQKVLRETHLTPLMRVALQNLKDFAVPLTVTFDNKKENFWKWHLVTENEFEGLVRKEFGLDEKLPEQKIVVPEPKAVAPEAKAVPIKKERKKRIVKEITKETVVQEKIVEGPKVEKKVELPKVETKTEQKIEKVESKPILKEELKPDIKKIKKKEIPAQEKAPEPVREEVKMEPKLELLMRVKNFFKAREIKVVQEQVIRKDAEVNYVIQIPSPVGQLSYLCKVYAKKSCSDKDVSGALVEGQLKKMPVVLVHDGTLTKKAQELAKTEPFRTMVFYQLNDGH